MSLAIVYTRAALGIEAPLITVEVHLSNGLPGLTMVGLPETTVKEARDRVRSALINSGYAFPAKKITINLAPADLPKEGGRYDLPIALALLVASEQLNTTRLNQYEFVGELALTGGLRGVPGAIPSAMEAIKAGRRIVVSSDNAAEVGLIGGSDCLVADHLQEVCAFLAGQTSLSPPLAEAPARDERYEDLLDVIGQQQGKRALESAAIQSLVNLHTAKTRWRQRPFRAPHHSASLAAMVGGGSIPVPGEISLAHNGVLFLDELPEFERRVLDALREPIESGKIHISRSRAKIDYPARFQLIAAMNPSPTGHYQGKHNRASPEQTLRYLGRLSGPFLDRFDLSLEIPLPPPGILSQGSQGEESSATVRQRVLAARERQMLRQNKLNAHLENREMKNCCRLRREDAVWLEQTLTQLGLSIRAWQRLLKVARTIADLAEVEEIERCHLQEALSYRAIDRMLNHLQKMMA
ncbi:MG(2+) CHELATASE FAMILY PROTEIN / ComM-related protein [Klebsiella pneumoniae]|uniref:YifB family Mg chelatase-like AAA ATPase n=1 Tax=Klebsiella pneumoniae TaxID=573 RepID=UPI000E2D591C|nr:YifB family Mg chelatase-like AAA ATPase [Klebsiella pneumoniae]SVS08970.1 MG(2+) CHELATASE FAMILY PROTEIN / ComM-related protein [Klebsiella pneumoniae]